MMKTLIALMIISGLLSCQNPIDKNAIGEKLMELAKERSKTAEKKDLEGFSSYWTEDAAMMFSEQPSIKGKDALKNMFKISFKMPGFNINWEPESVTVSDGGDMAYIIGKSTATLNNAEGQPESEVHQSLTVWKKESDGKWRNAVEIWTLMPKKK